MTTTSDDDLVGRDAELGVLAHHLDRGGGDVVVLGLHGDPGVGKTALLARAESRARGAGHSVLRTWGNPAEALLPYAGLHQLVRPLLTRVDALPDTQRDALLACFAMGPALEVNPFFAALAVLELVVDAARRAPVLLCLDDVDLVDQPSLDVLTFVARRVADEPVRVLCTARAEVAALGDRRTTRWVAVGALDPATSVSLLESRAPGLPPDLRDRVLRHALGNPLALVELAAALPDPDSRPEVDDELPMTARLEATFAGRADRLEPATRAVADAAAVDDGDRLSQVLAAAEVLHGGPVGRDGVADLLGAGLLTVSGDRYRMAHPLIGSALRRAMTPERRRTAHAALARVLAAEPDRALWHRASATTGPDEEVAAALERAAADARRRGAVATAVARLERAADLGADGEPRVQRLLDAAQLEYELGRFSRVEAIRTEVATMSLSAADRARLTWLDGVFHDGASSEPAEVRRLVALARTATADDDADLALQLLFGAARRVWWRDPGREVRHDIVRAVRAVPVPERDPRVLAALALAESAEAGAVVLDHLGSWPADPDRPDVSGLLGIAAFCTGDHERADTYLSAAAVPLRAQGRLSLLAEVLAIRSWSEVTLGIFDASRSADEAVRLADETGQAVWAATARTALAMADAVTGSDGAGRALLVEAERTALAMPNASTAILSGVNLVRGIDDLGADRPEQAFSELLRTVTPADPAFQRIQQLWSVSYLADAAVRTGRRDAALPVLAAVTDLAGPAPAPATVVALDHARAVLADDADAETRYRDALDGPARRHPWHRARLELALGTWLRRRRRVAESRDPLRAARATFAALGADAWARRTDEELRATGEPGWRPAERPRARLSAQEATIAELAARGLSNKEIGQHLFLSHRTVGSHLYRIFPKLGITTRAQLARALADQPVPDRAPAPSP